jgi:hypothetical protein
MKRLVVMLVLIALVVMLSLPAMAAEEPVTGIFTGVDVFEGYCGLPAFSPATDYMSVPGFVRHVYWEYSHTWITLDQAKELAKH